MATHQLEYTPGSTDPPVWTPKPSPSGGLDQVNAIYLSKAGNDSNNGLSVDAPKLTIESALTTAAAISGDAIVHIMDNGVYTAVSDVITVQNGVSISGPSATLVGYITLAAGSNVNIHAHYPTANDQVLVTSGGTGPSHYKANLVDGRGIGGTITGTIVSSPAASASISHVDINIAYIPASGFFYKDSGLTTTGHLHFRCGDIYLAGNSATGFDLRRADSNVIGYVDHILDSGFTSTVAIYMDDGDARLRIIAGEIICDTVYNVASGLLYLACPNVVGTRTGTPIVEFSQETGVFKGTTNVFTGVNDFGGASSLELPNSATPTVDADGEIAVDTTITNMSHGLIRYFSGEECVVIAVPTAEIGTLADGDGIFYNAANDEFEIKAPPSGSITRSSASLSSDVELTTSDTWYDGPSLSLAAGTWLINSHMLGIRTTTTATRFYSRITDKTNHYASGFNMALSNSSQGGTTSLTAIVTLASTTTIYIQGAASTGSSASLMKAAVPDVGSGNNATTITAIKLA
jgi:hypothetical protein